MRINECRTDALLGDQAGLYSMINLFSGGALLHLAIFALGIMPYITSSIILQLLTVVIPRLETLKKEGAGGQAKITQYTRYLTLVLAVLQATSFVTLAVNGQMFPRRCWSIIYDKGIFAIVVMVLMMTAGTGIIMWLGELITERGVGNGMSVLIFTQIAAPPSRPSCGPSRPPVPAPGLVDAGLIVAVGLLVMAGVVFVEQAQRRIPVQYAKRMVGNRLLGGTTTYIPLKVNQSGVIPVIFASSILYLPVLFSMFRPDNSVADLDRAQPRRPDRAVATTLIFFLLIIGLRVLLRRDHLRPRRGQRQHEEVRRLHPGHPGRQAHRGLSGLRAFVA